MATTALSTDGPSEKRALRQPLPSSNPLVFWHLLSLDAPTVAALWTWFFATANHVQLPAASVLAMAVAVWVLYVADRLLDTRAIDPASRFVPCDLEERHLFHRLNSRRFAIGIVFAAFALARLLPLLPQASIRLYGILGILLLAYFVLIHKSGSISRLPKELAVGAFFSAATCIPTISRQPSLRPVLLLAAMLFAASCSLNCLFIYAWEHTDGSGLAHPATRFALRFLAPISAICIASGMALALAPHLAWQIPVACAASIAFLLLLNSNRGRFAPSTQRAAADLCLLTPLLLLFSLR